jgi:hypothetical protein
MGFDPKRLLLSERVSLFVVVLGLFVVSLGVSSALAVGSVGWSVRSVSEPSQFSPNDALTCESEAKCDRYELLVANVGDVASSGTVTVTDKLPPGITTLEVRGGHRAGSLTSVGEGMEWSCTEGVGLSTVTCTLEGSVPAGLPAPHLDILVAAPSVGLSGVLRNEVSVSGGGATGVVSTSQETPIGSQLPQFGLSQVGMEPDTPGGVTSVQANGHPSTFVTSFGLPVVDAPPNQAGQLFAPTENIKDVVAELPMGFVGNPQVVSQRCTMTELRNERCPDESIVGMMAIRSAGQNEGAYTFSGDISTPRYFSAIYNMVPQGGYPAEFGFSWAGVPVYLYANVVHGPSGYRLRVATSHLPTILEIMGTVVTFYGEPGQWNGSGSTAAFLSNPGDCSAGSLSSRITVESWENPGHPVSRETAAYPQVTGCDLLQFDPSLGFAPSAAGEGGSTQADEPSAYTADVKVPQTSGFGENATPEVRTATVMLPVGVSISPAAAPGLVGCQAVGPEGINIGSSEVAAGSGQDLGDPEATELGAGHGGGNGSSYDDGLYHAASGHCPGASTIGTAEAFTPLLADGPGEAAPLKGHVYLAAPKCGGAGQSACTEASASNGELFGVYLELAGSGVIVKIPGTVSADPQTGRLTAAFKDAPQLPFGDLKLHFKGGPGAPLANPQTCGQATTGSVLEPWGAPAAPSATVSSSFSVDWDGNGGACPGAMPFAPGFTAGTLTPSAGAFSAFTLTLSRRDREQDFSGVSVQMPPGLLGVLKSVTLCGEPQAAQGTCGAGSLIGHTTVTAGAGSQPFPVTGQVFLTGPYKGAPFGLSIVVPAVAGPFNLGNVIVRAAVHVDPHTAQITVASDPLPQLVDGVPLRIQTVNVTVDRPRFMFNPTNCSAQQVTATIAAAQGATASVASPFAATGCAGLGFHPSFTASTRAATSKKNGASLDVKVGYPTGSQANIRSTAVVLPKQLPARLTTIQQACPEATFAANPASCPAGSNIGTATATTPLLAGALSGPAYLVSHGGAAFPDVTLVLQGEGVTLVLVGSVNIKHGITSSTFASIPDAPISSFELNLPEGPHSGLTAVLPAKAKGNLCGTNLTMPTTITGQNGAQIKQNTKIQVTGCTKAKPKKKTKRHKHSKKGRK